MKRKKYFFMSGSRHRPLITEGFLSILHSCDYWLTDEAIFQISKDDYRDESNDFNRYLKSVGAVKLKALEEFPDTARLLAVGKNGEVYPADQLPDDVNILGYTVNTEGDEEVKIKQYIDSLPDMKMNDGTTLKESALENNELWNNDSCRGYCIRAMQEAGFSYDQIKSVVSELRWSFDEITVDDARRLYESFLFFEEESDKCK